MTLRAHAPRRGRTVLAGIALLTAAACSTSATAPCRAPTAVAGSWRYSAVQDAPVRMTLSGTLVLSSQACSALSGSLDVIAVSDRGTQQRVAGAVTGQIVDQSSLQFDAMLDAMPRQHLAKFLGDSLSGTWIELAPDGSSVTGTFTAKREATP